MTTASTVEVSLEAQGAQPNFRYDLLQPLLQGRVTIEGATLKPSGPTDSAGFNDNPKFPAGDFALLDANWGDLLAAIAAGWDFKFLPVFIKRKPVYNYLWVRADRGIDAPKDIEGKLMTTGGYTSAITTYTRGLLNRHYGVDLDKIRYLLAAPGRFDLHKQIEVEYATGPRKSPVQRLLDGEVDISTGDITDPAAWEALESSSQVKRLFSDYQELNFRLATEEQLYTPVHVIVIGGKFDRANPGLARRIYDAFERSREMAWSDALGDGSSYSMMIHNREKMKQQLADWGDVYKTGSPSTAPPSIRSSTTTSSRALRKIV